MAIDLGEDTGINMEVVAEILSERVRQIERGFNALHDDGHENGELLVAAMWYLMSGLPLTEIMDTRIPDWPFYDAQAPEPGLDVKNLVKAAALIIAEIERIKRVAERDKNDTVDVE